MKSFTCVLVLFATLFAMVYSKPAASKDVYFDFPSKLKFYYTYYDNKNYDVFGKTCKLNYSKRIISCVQDYNEGNVKKYARLSIKLHQYENHCTGGNVKRIEDVEIFKPSTGGMMEKVYKLFNINKLQSTNKKYVTISIRTTNHETCRHEYTYTNKDDVSYSYK